MEVKYGLKIILWMVKEQYWVSRYLIKIRIENRRCNIVDEFKN